MTKNQGWFLILLVATTAIVCAIDLVFSSIAAKDTGNSETTAIVELLTRGPIVSPIIEVDIDGNGFKDYLYLNERTLEAQLHFSYDYDYDWGLNDSTSRKIEIAAIRFNKMPDSQKADGTMNIGETMMILIRKDGKVMRIPLSEKTDFRIRAIAGMFISNPLLF